MLYLRLLTLALTCSFSLGSVWAQDSSEEPHSSLESQAPAAPSEPAQDAELELDLAEEAELEPAGDTPPVLPRDPLPRVATPEPAPVDTPEEEPVHKTQVVFEGATYFEIYQKGGDPEVLQQQANEASERLARALRALPPESATESVRFESSRNALELLLADLPIFTFNRDHLEAAGFASFEVMEKEVETELFKSLEERAIKIKWQNRAKNFFLTFLYIALAVLIFRQLGSLFEKAEEALLERKERFQPISIFSETLVQGQTVGAFLTLLLVVGRFLAYALVFVLTILAVLNQFDSSRSLLSDFFQHLASVAVEGLQSLVEAIPSMILGVALILGLYFSLKIVSLYLRSLALGRIKFKALPPYRLPVAKFWLPLVLVLLFVPLIIAAILTIRFSSMEVGVVSFGIICLLAFLPVLTSAAIGSFQMWNGNLQEGHWIEVGKYHGEVTGISLFEVSLVPEDGGMVRLPMIYLLMNPVRYRAEVPKFEIRFTVKKMGSLTETLDTVAQLFPEKWNVDVSCQSVNSHEVRIVLRAGKFESKIKSETLRILSDACDEKKIELTSDFVEEISH